MVRPAAGAVIVSDPVVFERLSELPSSLIVRGEAKAVGSNVIDSAAPASAESGALAMLTA
jgi:hypothetical protein